MPDHADTHPDSRCPHVSGPWRADAVGMARSRHLVSTLLVFVIVLTAGSTARADDGDSIAEQTAIRKARVVYNVPNRDNAVFITIDDGGYASPAFGRWLDRLQVPITNFVMPEMLHLHRAWYRDRQFMTFENHTNTHAHMTLISPAEQEREICRASRLIEGIVKERPRLYRPPRGSWNDDSRTAAARCGITHLVMWSATADGGVIRTPGNRSLRSGDIVILHYNDGLPATMAHLLATIDNHGLKPAFLRDYLR